MGRQVGYGLTMAPATSGAPKASDPTAFDVRYGAIIIRATDIVLRVGIVIAAPVIVYYAKKKLGPLAGAFISAPMVQAQLEQARATALNAVETDMHGRVAHVSGAPVAIAEGIKHLLDLADVDRLAAHAIRAMGGPEMAAKRLWAMLPLPPDATAGNSLVPALEQLAPHIAALPPKTLAAVRPPVKR